MLIRSQDKLQLINLENGTTAVDYRNKKNILFYDIGSVEPTSTIGEYSSEEKVIKVLDMIQDNYAKLDCVHHGVYIHGDCVSVFQMPQDEEVEV